MTNSDMIKSAKISDCGKFRFALGRVWDPSLLRLGFVMLNPSTADADRDDATIRKCLGFARHLGYGSVMVTNLYAFRATSPKDLKTAGYAVGLDNDMWIRMMIRTVNTVVCAWGVNARGHARAQHVMDLIPEPKALRLTSDNVPCHPLMLPYTCQLIDMKVIK
jgi:hypothetical protein